MNHSVILFGCENKFDNSSNIQRAWFPRGSFIPPCFKSSLPFNLFPLVKNVLSPWENKISQLIEIDDSSIDYSQENESIVT